MSFWSDLIGMLFGHKAVQTVLILVVSPGSPEPLGQKMTVTGKLVRKDNMGAIGNASIAVSVTDPTAVVTNSIVTTDATGKASLTMTLTKVGTYTISWAYAGVPNQYKPVSTSVSVPVLAAAVPTTLTLTLSETSGTAGDPLTISGVLQTA